MTAPEPEPEDPKAAARAAAQRERNKAEREASIAGGLDELSATWRESGRFTPSMAEQERDRRLAGWHRAVAQARHQGPAKGEG